MQKRMFLVVVGVLFFAFAKAQDRSTLEQKKQRIEEQIRQLDKVLKSTRGKEAGVMAQVQALNQKIDRAADLMSVTRRQSRILTDKISKNQNEITALEQRITKLQKEYAAALRRSQKTGNDSSRLMFLLSADNFLQAYKRLQYFKTYAAYREKQAIRIKDARATLEHKTAELEEKKKEQEKLLAEQRQLRERLKEDKQEQEVLLAEVQKDKEKYAAQIKRNQKESARVEAEIQRLIAAEIAKANKGKTKTSTSSTKFVLTPEAKALAADFARNKGKLPWPVDKGIITRRYGKQPHPVVPTIQIMSNGVRIQSPENTEARAVFKGEVMQIQKSRSGLLSVFVRHGDYITIYKNLKSIAVAKGDKVETYDRIGTVFTDLQGVSELQFLVMKNTSILNPGSWILRQ